jgi:NAD(P)-dependent dehydrogenase (short-subunit alcohol dehydrogenase family)
MTAPAGGRPTPASRAGIIALSLPASRDLAGTGIRVNSIVAGGFDTPILTGIVGTDDTVTEALVPLIAQFPNPRRLVRPDEFARFAAHIAENSYVNLAALRIDAGYRIQL